MSCARPSRTNRGLRRLLGFLALALALPVRGAAAADAPREFDLPAGDATDTLRRFVRQSGEQVIYFVDQVRGVGTRPVRGRMTALEALQGMLRGTRLHAVEDDRTGALLVAGPAPAPRRGAAPPAAAAGAPAPAPAGNRDAPGFLRLPRFEVTGRKSDPYRSPEAVSGARIRGGLIDTPLSINVVTRELLDDVGANSLYEATRYFPGVSSGRGSGPGGIMDRQDFRGFESFTKTIDDFSTQLIPASNGFVAVFEPQFVERAELVMGPDTILAPTGSPGGSMNLITKSPSFEAASTLGVTVGNLGAGKATVDSTGPLGGDWAYRAIADVQDARTYLPGRIRQWDASAQASYRLSDQARLTLKYFGTQWELTGAAANVNDSGWEVTDPASIGGATIAPTPPPSSGFTYGGWNGDAPWSHTFDRVNLFSAQLSAPLGEAVTMRLGAQALFDNNVGDSGYPAAGPAEIFDPATGQVSGLIPVDPAALPEVARFNHAVSRDLQLQNDFAGSWQLGPASLQPVAGWTWQRGVTATETRQYALPNADLLAGPYDPPKPPLSAYTPSVRNRPEAWQAQAYALARVGLARDRLLLTVGASRVWVRSVNSVSLAPAPAGGSPALSGGRNTVLAGLLVRLTPSVSVYANYATNAALTNAADRPLWQQGRQYEFGLKSDFFGDRLSLTAAHFEIGQGNIVSPNPLFNVDPAHNPSSTLSNQSSRGSEINLIGGLTRHLSVIASWTGMKFRDQFGRRARNVPDRLASALLSYRFEGGWLGGASVFAGAVHAGQAAGENAPNQLTALGVPEQVGFYLPGWTVWNAGAGCRWGRYRLRLNLDNLLGARFGWEPSSRLSVSPYPGPAFRLTATVGF